MSTGKVSPVPVKAKGRDMPAFADQAGGLFIKRGMSDTFNHHIRAAPAIVWQP